MSAREWDRDVGADHILHWLFGRSDRACAARRKADVTSADSGRGRLQDAFHARYCRSRVSPGLFLLPNFHRVLYDVIWQKSQSLRVATWRTAVHALHLALETVGLGVGLGSNRPSGLLFYILSNMEFRV